MSSDTYAAWPHPHTRTFFTVREVAERLAGGEPTRSGIESARRLVNAAVKDGLLEVRDDGAGPMAVRPHPTGRRPRCDVTGAPVKDERRARTTRTLVRVLDNTGGHVDSDDGAPIYLLCVDHGGITSFPSWNKAGPFVAHPEEWCPTCQEAAGTDHGAR